MQVTGLTGDTVYQLQANVTDAENADGELNYQGQTFLHHNDHQHAEAVDAKHATTTVISPVGCDGNIYHDNDRSETRRTTPGLRRVPQGAKRLDCVRFIAAFSCIQTRRARSDAPYLAVHGEGQRAAVPGFLDFGLNSKGKLHPTSWHLV